MFITEERDGLLLREITMRDDRRRVRAKYVYMLIALFLAASALIYRYNMVIEINGDIRARTAELEALENQNSVVRKSISMEVDLEKIRLLAESRLNMQKPDRYQIVYIKVPKKDHALVEVEAEQTVGEDLVESLVGQFVSVRDRLFPGLFAQITASEIAKGDSEEGAP